MYCPKCKSSQNKKNGFRRGKQSYRCKNCGCQYVENPKLKAYPQEVKQLCLKMQNREMSVSFCPMAQPK